MSLAWCLWRRRLIWSFRYLHHNLFFLQKLKQCRNTVKHVKRVIGGCRFIFQGIILNLISPETHDYYKKSKNKAPLINVTGTEADYSKMSPTWQNCHDIVYRFFLDKKLSVQTQCNRFALLNEWKREQEF